MAKKADLRAAKERRQKLIAGVGGVILVIVLFVQVPRTMKMLNDGSEEPVAAAPAPPPAAGAPGAAPAPAAPAAEPQVVTASLVSFSRFASKDPFVQQVRDGQGSAGDGSAGSAGGGEGEDGAITEPDEGSAPGEPTAFTQAEISVNGVSETLRVDTPFPATNPMFLLVSVSKKSVGIKVADGGTFASGAATLTLTLGKPVTLVNTADGTRFVLLLEDVS